MLGQLVPVGGGDPIPLLQARVVVGRRPSCDIVLEFSNVSSQHCELLYEQGHWKMHDFGSSNGTKVNGVRYDQRWLNPGDEITFAKHKFSIEYVPGSSDPAPVNEEESPFSRSLLEKAGLADPDRRPRPPRPSSNQPPRPETRPPGRSTPAPDPASKEGEDDILRWLSDE